MPATKKLLSQNNEDSQILRVNSLKRFIVVKSNDWQLLFNSRSSLGSPDLRVRGAAEFDSESFTKIRMTAYLFDQVTNSVSLGSSCLFKLYKVIQPQWQEIFITNLNGSIINSNSYFFAEIDTNLIDVDLLGETTFMVSATVQRLDKSYTNRFYLNHAGIYANCFKLKQDINYLDLIKMDE